MRIDVLKRIAPIVYEYCEDESLVDEYSKLLEDENGMNNILDYCRTLYAIWCRDGTGNGTFNGVLESMFEELKDLDGEESMRILQEEALKPPKYSTM